MTEKDLKLIEEAKKLSRWDYRKVDLLMDQAESNEAYDRLYYIRCELRESCLETL